MIRFPDPRHSDENGIVYIGGEPSVENLLDAYSKGIFPWPHKGWPLLWFSPWERGVLDFENFKIPKSTKKQLKKMDFKITVDRAFDEVIAHCVSQKRDETGGTWITPEIVEGYKKLFRAGFAHSIECWQQDVLVGGLYGVYVQGVFSGESMFFKLSGASKACLIATVETLQSMGHTWFDIQMVTSVLEQFGGSYIPRADYLQRLKKTQQQKIPWKI